MIGMPLVNLPIFSRGMVTNCGIGVALVDIVSWPFKGIVTAADSSDGDHRTSVMGAFESAGANSIARAPARGICPA